MNDFFIGRHQHRPKKEPAMKSALFAVMTVLGAAACSSAQASKLNPNDDLHCSVVSTYFAMSEPGKSDAAARALFIASAWYNKRIGNKPDPSKAAPVLDKVKGDREAARPILIDCMERAMNDPVFEVFGREAVAAWNQVTEESAAEDQ
jgi:hypothetical protein